MEARIRTTVVAVGCCCSFASAEETYQLLKSVGDDDANDKDDRVRKLLLAVVNSERLPGFASFCQSDASSFTPAHTHTHPHT